ncbi:Telomere end binding protein [Penicillium soppii]|uniref:Telomere end binding protein n=1 Tax=Penicillium soppii TaxID=69789 RepID=UPI002549B32F|nr:Telomere end binding protein [Penicillium soppii]KAJ5851368.1 Telomere end binding protein [Penicillium soppii]
MDAIEQPPAPNALGELTQVPINKLSPGLEQPAEKSILAAVTLVWPYSSSTKTFCLLLAEPDFRLRSSNGQVKVTFHGRAAEKIAKSHVGIGDSICLGLNGSEFIPNQSASGRSIAWDAHFEKGVFLEVILSRVDFIAFSHSGTNYISNKQVRRPSQDPLTVHVEHATDATVQEVELAPPVTPSGKSTNLENDFASSTGSWKSPAFLKPARPSFGGTNRSVLDPFVQDDGFVPGKGRKKARYSLQREDWRILVEPDSPHENEGPVDWAQALDQELDEVETEEEPIDDLMKDAADAPASTEDVLSKEPPQVFAKPSIEHTGHILERRAEEANKALSHDYHQAQFHLPTDTPQIRPIPSPGLPVPSPLVSDHAGSTEYFSSWTATAEAQKATSFSTEPATPPRSFIETFGTETQTIDFHRTDPVGLDVESEQGYVFEASYPLRDDVVSISATDEQDFSQDPSNQAMIYNDALLEDKDKHLDTFEANDKTGVIQDDVEINSAGETADEIQHVDVQSEENIVTDRHEAYLGPDVESVQLANERNVKEDSVSINESVHHAPPTADLDMDAIHALEMMMGVREKEEIQTHENVREKLESGDEIDDSSRAIGTLDHSHSEDYSEEDEEMINEEDGYDEQSADNYDSQDDYDEEGLQGQEGSSVDESDADDSELEQDFPSLARPAQPHEIIILDSDSEDEPASKPQATSSSQPPAEDCSSNRSESADSAIPLPTAEFTTDRQEEAGPWGVGPEQRDYTSAEEESDGDQSEEDESEEDESKDLEHYDMDARAHDSDKDDESTQGPSDPLDRLEMSQVISEQDEDETMDSMKRSDNEESHLQARIGSPVDFQSPGEQVSDNNDSNLPGTAETPHQDRSGSVESHHEHLSHSGSATMYFNLDGAAESHITPAAEIDGTDSLVGEHILQPPEPLGNLSSFKPQFEQPPLTPDPIQEVTTLDSFADLEHATTFTIEGQEAPVEVDTTSQPLPVFGSTESGEEDASQLDDRTDKYFDAVTAPLGIPEAVISTQTPQTPSVLVQPPVPDRHASGLRSKLSYFAPLATLVDHYNALVDTISIIQEVSPIARSKAGSKDWFVTIQLTDPSMAGTTLNAQIFRAYKSSMPSLAEGSAILLRDFKVRSFEHALMLVSVESSAWAVFDGSGPEAEISGPPVEYDSQERAYASGLRRWYTEVGSASVADYMLQASVERDSVDRDVTPNSEVPSESGSPNSKRASRRKRRSNRQVTIHELRDGTRYTEAGSPNSRNSSVHELRDGTLYANI